MKEGFINDTRNIIDDALANLSKAPPPKGAPGVTAAESFLVLSRKSRLFIEVQIATGPRTDKDSLLLALYDFLTGNPILEEKNIYQTTLGQDSMLIEVLGETLFCEVFSGQVQRSHYKKFHDIVRSVTRRFPELALWDGDLANLPPGLQQCIGEQVAAAPAVPRTAAPPAPAAMVAPKTIAEPPLLPIVPPEEPAPNMEFYEKKMRGWYEAGLVIDPLKSAIHDDLRVIKKAFEQFAHDVDRLRDLRKEVDDLEFEGFEDDVRRLRSMLKDTRRINDIEQGIGTLMDNVQAKYGIRLPVADRGEMAQAIKSLPLGIPSILWGIPLDRLVDEMFASERGLTPDASAVVRMKERWFNVDPRRTDFMNFFQGKVRTERELLQERYKMKRDSRLDDILTKILEPRKAQKRD